MSVKIVSKSDSVSISVKVTTGASKTALAGMEEEFLKIRVAAVPVDGKANQELIGYLAKLLSVPKSKIHIQSGLNSRRKVVRVEHYDGMKLRELLLRLEKNQYQTGVP